MVKFITYRFIYMVLLVTVMSFLGFVIINLPPGSFVETQIQQLRMSGNDVSETMLVNLTRRYGMDKPFMSRYVNWIKNMFKGDFGESFLWGKPVLDVISSRLPFTMILVLSSTVFVYLVAIPIATYSATHQYSFGDYLATLIGFMGLAIPNFLFALILMYILYKYFGMEVGGYVSSEFSNSAWSIAKVLDVIEHILPAIIVTGTAGTAGLIRTLRGTLLDELNKQYVQVARAKGLKFTKLLFKYPLRIALNPIISTIGWILPSLISGGTIVAIVLNLPTLGSVLYNALLNQDMYLGGTIIIFQTILTLVGTFISDLLLVWSDPRIKFE